MNQKEWLQEKPCLNLIIKYLFSIKIRQEKPYNLHRKCFKVSAKTLDLSRPIFITILYLS